MTKVPPISTEQLLDDWYRRARESQFAHYNAAYPLASANYRLGLPVIVLSTFVATSVFATLESSTALGYRIAVGIISVSAAVLSALQTFLRFEERAEKHRTAGGQYGALRRELEAARAAGAPYDPALIARVREQFDSIANQAPEIPPRIWSRTEATLAAREVSGRPMKRAGA
jgi:hypothetical protein